MPSRRGLRELPVGVALASVLSALNRERTASNSRVVRLLLLVGGSLGSSASGVSFQCSLAMQHTTQRHCYTMALWLSRTRAWCTRSSIHFTACAIAVLCPSVTRAQSWAPRIEIAGGIGRSGLAVPPQHPLIKYGPTGIAAVHVALSDWAYVGVDATGWRMSEAGETSQTLFVLASTRIYFPQVPGLSLMGGIGLGHGTYASFQHPDTNDSPTVNRFGFGFGAGYEVPPSGPVTIGIYGRTMNTLGSWKQSNVEFQPPVRQGNSVLTTVGISLAWRRLAAPVQQP